MKFYRTHRRDQVDSSFGYTFTTSRAAAADVEAMHFATYPGGRKDAAEPRADTEEIEIEPTKAGILAALNRYASHPDNG